MYTQTIAIARCLLSEGRLADLDRMIAPLLGNGLPASRGMAGARGLQTADNRLLLQCLLAQTRLFSGTSPAQILHMFGDDPPSPGDPGEAMGHAVSMLTTGLALLPPGAETQDLPRALHLFQATQKTLNALRRSDYLHWTYLGQAAALHALGESKEAGDKLEQAAHILAVLHDRVAAYWLAHLSEALEHARPVPFDGLYNIDPHKLLTADVPASTGLATGPTGDKVFISEEMQHLLGKCRVAAEGAAPMLVLGERGSGKETLARIIHGYQMAERGTSAGDCDDSFDVIDCDAIASSWNVSQYLSSLQPAGRRSAADPQSNIENPRTLFLNHVEHLPPEEQQALLAFLQAADAGGYDQMPVRVISASSAKLPDLVARGAFDADLYHRLKIRTLEIPPLRMRRQDIPLLALHFAGILRPPGVSTVAITEHAFRAFLNYDWPGNIRQLRNEVERILVHVGIEPLPTIDLENISESIRKKKSHDWAFDAQEVDAEFPLDEILAHTEKTVIERVLDKYQGQVSAAADALGLTRQGLYKKLKRLGIRLSH